MSKNKKTFYYIKLKLQKNISTYFI